MKFGASLLIPVRLVLLLWKGFHCLLLSVLLGLWLIASETLALLLALVLRREVNPLVPKLVDLCLQLTCSTPFHMFIGYLAAI